MKQRNFCIGSQQQGQTKVAIEANNGTYCLRKQIEKFPLYTFVTANG